MLPLIILGLGSLTHLIRLGYPLSVVFDEVFYGNFLSYYWQGSYFFDQHPPFFKLFISFLGQFIGLNQYSANWDSIGNALPEELALLRLVPMIAGIILPLIIYALCRRLDFSKSSSFLVAVLLSLENSLIVQSRFLLPDIVMLVAGFSAILFYLEYNKRLGLPRRSWFFALSTIMASIALSIKWTGLTFLFLIIVMESYRLFTESTGFKNFLKKISVFSLKYLIIAMVIYVSLFVIHFKALPNSGKGDPFMSWRFQKTLIGNKENNNTELEPIGFWGKFTELNRVMFTANSGMTATHSYSSKWYTWPIMKRSIFYWQDNAPASGSPRSYIYLLGNPLVYWLGTFSIVCLLIYGLYKIIIKKSLNKDPENSNLIIFLLVGYVINFLPFALIGRVMFLYHYEVALVFSIIAIGYLFDFLEPKKKLYSTIIIIIIATSAFIYWSPLTYGIPLTDKQLTERMWLPSWR